VNRDELKLVIFDWDGTLMDSTAHIVASVQAAAQDIGLPPPSEERARSVIGLSLDRALATALPGLSPERAQAFAMAYRERYLAADRDEGALFPGVEALLNRLDEAGIWTAVATGKGRAGLDRAMAEMGVSSRFLVTRCADESRSKPHPQMLEELLDWTGLEAHQALMVGDSSFDLDMARSLGMASVGVTSGAHSAERLRQSEPLVLLEDVAQLSDWLRLS